MYFKKSSLYTSVRKNYHNLRYSVMAITWHSPCRDPGSIPGIGNFLIARSGDKNKLTIIFGVREHAGD